MTDLRTQSKRASFIEAIANTAIGFLVSLIANLLIFKALGIEATRHQIMWQTGLMTVLSVVRGYTLRRMWNAEWWKRFKRNHPTNYGPKLPPYCVGCRCVFDVATQKTVRYGCTCGQGGEPEETPASIRTLTPEQLAERVNKLSPEDHMRLGRKLGL